MSNTEEKYKSGICNIGEREVAIRQKLLLFSFLATVILTIIVHFLAATVVYFILFLSSFFTVLILFEIKTKFCIIFGIFSLYNFKEPGNLDNVTDGHCRKKDRSKALKYMIVSALLAFPYVFVIWFFTR